MFSIGYRYIIDIIVKQLQGVTFLILAKGTVPVDFWLHVFL
jgi:hypothetical protein